MYRIYISLFVVMNKKSNAKSLSDVMFYDVTVSLALLNVFSQKLADRMQILATVGKTCAIAVIIFYGMRNIFQGLGSNTMHIKDCVCQLLLFLEIFALINFAFHEDLPLTLDLGNYWLFTA